jgi:hypothetical protein
MTKLFNTIAAAGALLVLNGATALAQSNMKVDVPFAFQTPTSQLPAGQYFITEVGTRNVMPFYRIQHGETGESVLVVAPGNTSRKPNMNALPAQVAFRCAADVCALAEIFPLGSDRGFSIPVKLKNVPKTAALNTVTLRASAE